MAGMSFTFFSGKLASLGVVMDLAAFWAQKKLQNLVGGNPGLMADLADLLQMYWTGEDSDVDLGMLPSSSAKGPAEFDGLVKLVCRQI